MSEPRTTRSDIVIWRRRVLRLLDQAGPLAGLVVMMIVFWLLNARFLSGENVTNVAGQTAALAISAIGMTFVIVSGGIDLSVGSTQALVGVVAALWMRVGVDPWHACALALCVGALCGLLNGVMISLLRLPPFIVTLGTMGAFKGVSMLLSDSMPVVGMPETFQVLGVARAIDLGRDYAVPWSLVVTLGSALVAGFVLRYTRFGRYIYATGSNEQTARLCGVSVQRVKIGAYVVSGLAAGLAGMIVASRMNSASPEAPGVELEVIAAVVIGGGSLMGGQGTVIGTLVGAFLMRFLRNGCNLVGVTTIVQWIVVGVVIILAALLDKLRHGATRGAGDG